MPRHFTSQENPAPRTVAQWLKAIERGEADGSARVLPSRADITLYELLSVGDREDWVADRVARVLGIGRATLWRCLRRLGVSLQEEKKWAVVRTWNAVHILVRGGAREDETIWNDCERKCDFRELS